MKRRTFITGCMAAGLATPAIAASSASRTFTVLWGGDPFGTHVLEAVQNGDRFEMIITIRLQVRILGVTAYRYELDNREVWQRGQLISINSKTNDDGDAEFAKAERNGGALVVDGSGYKGNAPVEAATTSYYVPAMLERSPWISTQSGRPLDISIRPEGRDGWWQVSGGLETKLGYDGRGEWTGCEFDAGGEPGTYEIASQSGSISALWAAA